MSSFSEPQKWRNARTLCLTTVVILTITGGSANTFGLYGPRLARDLHFTQYQVGTISTVMMASVYLLTPMFGWISQLTSPGFLSAFSAVAFSVGYLLMAHIFAVEVETSDNNGSSHVSLLFIASICAHVLIGAATSALIMASMTACAVSVDKSPAKGVIMAIPVSCLGVSGTLHSFVATILFTKPYPSTSSSSNTAVAGHEVELDVVRYFRYLAVLLLFGGIFGAFGLVTPVESKKYDRPLSTETISQSFIQGRNDESCGEYGTISMSVAPVHSKDVTVSVLLQDPALWYMATANMLLNGICETYNLNLGSIIMSNTNGTRVTGSPEDLVARHVTALAIGSTLARLGGGYLFDRLSSLEATSKQSSDVMNPAIGYWRSPVLILLVMSASCTLGLALLAYIPDVTADTVLFAVTLLMGLTYGASSLLAPLATQFWSSKRFGLAYGIINMSPALGIGFFGFLYSTYYEQQTSSSGSMQNQCLGWACYGKWAERAIVGSTVCIALHVMIGRRLNRES